MENFVTVTKRYDIDFDGITQHIETILKEKVSPSIWVTYDIDDEDDEFVVLDFTINGDDLSGGKYDFKEDFEIYKEDFKDNQDEDIELMIVSIIDLIKTIYGETVKRLEKQIIAYRDFIGKEFE